MSIDQQILHEKLWENYEDFKYDLIRKRRFKYEEITPFILELENNELFNVEVLGKSFEERDIYKVSWGKGKTPVLLWSQMHGNESTATRAFLDIITFFSASDHFNSLRDEILENLTIHFIPVLNPDGMQRFQRRTAQEIDLNRDAVRVQTPESEILRDALKNTKAEFGFNLHDQKIYYGAGHTGKPAAISFLSPPYNEKNEVNEVRKNSMNLIVELNEILQAKIPQMVARYDDKFNPRAFGDNIQKWGTSTILVESGGYKNDPEKEFIRKLNYFLLINAFYSISHQNFLENETGEYYQIPENEEIIFDLILRNAAITKDGRQYKADIGIIREELDYNDARDYYYKSRIEDIGDLSMYYGYEEMDLNGMTCDTGSLYHFEFETHYELANYDFRKILDHGYTHAVVQSSMETEQFVEFPVNILMEDSNLSSDFKEGAAADFVIKDGKKVIAVIINGFLYLPDGEIKIANGLIY